ncbi:1-acyl-sn-glycerol-3-phosphate acyltransferase [Pseudenhygromyxa sp. WMMC2535]|uniref:lysophospholipid acyltransferase family protein n=1 Tax=Pseudenhygromyxa sp. WMMC2535 TaxID=2712867 RepID=UPI001553FF43|nr:lysophospholipid acyltransferase family protein [Pseudenhygromyxa sp. WMMC2535]NVB38254.1 1-acyl-sn-glycerol-3-phosphate acyltransferase [Pseudenhygromyxa sp. WMMC2535]
MPEPRRGFEGLSPGQWVIYRGTWLAISPLLMLARLRGFGHREIPRRGPMLLLPNHHTMIDPFMAGWLPLRPARFMASAQPLKKPLLGPWLKALGAFPKHKFIKDRAAMEELQRLYDDGHLITIFPEGSRSWNGRTREIGGGIGRLIKRLDAEVVIARLVSAHYLWPRWARYPRFVPNHIEYEGPLRWPPEATAEEITEDIRRLLTCEQRIPEGAFTLGWRMAHGLPAYLWACPSCFAEHGLRVHPRRGNWVACGSCGATWRLRVDTRLEAQGDHESFDVATAHDRLVEHFGPRPVMDDARFASEGVALETEHGRLLRAQADRRGFELIAEGRLRLTAEAIEVGPEPWRLPYADLVAVSVELGNKVQLRTADDLYRLELERDQVLQWGHFIHEWRCSVQGLPRSPLG